MICYRPRFRFACALTLLLIAGLIFPAAVQARPLEEEPPSLAGIVWEWIADHFVDHPVDRPVPGDRFVHLSGKEGWGMDPNGGKAGLHTPAPQINGGPQ